MSKLKCDWCGFTWFTESNIEECINCKAHYTCVQNITHACSDCYGSKEKPNLVRYYGGCHGHTKCERMCVNEFHKVTKEEAQQEVQKVFDHDNDADFWHDEYCDLIRKTKKWQDALKDLRDHGARHDTMPTNAHNWDVMRLYQYIKNMDSHVRNIARKALENDE